MSERSFSQAHPIVVAHRGAPLIEPENTIPSFEAAVAAGADAVEFDVRLSADGQPVIKEAFLTRELSRSLERALRRVA